MIILMMKYFIQNQKNKNQIVLIEIQLIYQKIMNKIIIINCKKYTNVVIVT